MRAPSLNSFVVSILGAESQRKVLTSATSARDTIPKCNGLIYLCSEAFYWRFVIYHCPYQWSAYVYPYTTPFISACCVSLKYGRARMQPAVNGMGTMNLNNMDIMNRMAMGSSNCCLPY